nr:unnamed protein product [Spirometra erinaceieuropaei]
MEKKEEEEEEGEEDEEEDEEEGEKSDRVGDISRPRSSFLCLRMLCGRMDRQKRTNDRVVGRKNGAPELTLQRPGGGRRRRQ